MFSCNVLIMLICLISAHLGYKKIFYIQSHNLVNNFEIAFIICFEIPVCSCD